MAYPTEVDINPKHLRRLTAMFKRAYRDIVAEINNATDFGIANRQQILAQIEVILTKLGVDVDAFLRSELPKYYNSGLREAVMQLRNIGLEIPVGGAFNQVHYEAIEALIADTARSFGESISGVGRSANRLLGKAVRDAITQKISKGIIAGDAIEQIKKEIKGMLAENGLSALIDKSGREWSLDRYAEMLFRTKAVEARNRGMINRVAQEGYDLVQVSDNGQSACPLCAPWQGEILSVTGATSGYTSLATAEDAGLFHPNCRHAINTVVPSLARKTRAYDASLNNGEGGYGAPGASLGDKLS